MTTVDTETYNKFIQTINNIKIKVPCNEAALEAFKAIDCMPTLSGNILDTMDAKIHEQYVLTLITIQNTAISADNNNISTDSTTESTDTEDESDALPLIYYKMCYFTNVLQNYYIFDCNIVLTAANLQTHLGFITGYHHYCEELLLNIDNNLNLNSEELNQQFNNTNSQMNQQVDFIEEVYTDITVEVEKMKQYMNEIQTMRKILSSYIDIELTFKLVFQLLDIIVSSLNAIMYEGKYVKNIKMELIEFRNLSKLVKVKLSNDATSGIINNNTPSISKRSYSTNNIVRRSYSISNMCKRSYSKNQKDIVVMTSQSFGVILKNNPIMLNARSISDQQHPRELVKLLNPNYTIKKKDLPYDIKGFLYDTNKFNSNRHNHPAIFESTDENKDLSMVLNYSKELVAAIEASMQNVNYSVMTGNAYLSSEHSSGNNPGFLANICTKSANDLSHVDSGDTIDPIYKITTKILTSPIFYPAQPKAEINSIAEISINTFKFMVRNSNLFAKISNDNRIVFNFMEYNKLINDKNATPIRLLNKEQLDNFIKHKQDIIQLWEDKEKGVITASKFYEMLYSLLDIQI